MTAKTYQIEVTEKQLQILSEATELMSRIGMGQLGEVLNHCPDMVLMHRPALQDLLDSVKVCAWNVDKNAYHSVNSEKIRDEYRIASDMYHVFRYRLAWDRNPKGNSGVHFDDPAHYSREPLAKFLSDEPSYQEKLDRQRIRWGHTLSTGENQCLSQQIVQNVVKVSKARKSPKKTGKRSAGARTSSR